MGTDLALMPFDPEPVVDLCRELDTWRARLDSERIHEEDLDRGRLAAGPLPDLP